MTHSLKEFDDSKNADVIRQDYVSKLRKKQYSDCFVDPNDEEGYTPEMDEVKTRIKNNFDSFNFSIIQLYEKYSIELLFGGPTLKNSSLRKISNNSFE